jgi:hypothetical protein
MSGLLRRTLGQNISIETIQSGGLWMASADINPLENALLNLALNARDAMPSGWRLTVETATKPFQSSALIGEVQRLLTEPGK